MMTSKARSVTRVTAAEQLLLRWMLSRPNARLMGKIARWVSRLGDGPAYFATAALMYWLLIPGADLFLKILALGFAIELPLYWVLKNTIRRDRPCDAIMSLGAFIKPSDKFSFPSGHTAGGFVFAYAVLQCFPGFALAAYTLGAMIGMSRVMLGVHYPTDIAAGAALGTGTAMIAFSFI